jgi:hypothetical protein
MPVTIGWEGSATTGVTACTVGTELGEATPDEPREFAKIQLKVYAVESSKPVTWMAV